MSQYHTNITLSLLDRIRKRAIRLKEDPLSLEEAIKECNDIIHLSNVATDRVNDIKAGRNAQGNVVCEFAPLGEAMIKYLCENHHPHTTIIITPTTAEILKGVKSIATKKYIKD